MFGSKDSSWTCEALSLRNICITGDVGDGCQYCVLEYYYVHGICWQVQHFETEHKIMWKQLSRHIFVLYIYSKSPDKMDSNYLNTLKPEFIDPLMFLPPPPSSYFYERNIKSPEQFVLKCTDASQKIGLYIWTQFQSIPHVLLCML